MKPAGWIELHTTMFYWNGMGYIILRREAGMVEVKDDNGKKWAWNIRAVENMMR